MSEHARQLATDFLKELSSQFDSLEDLCNTLVSPLHAFGLTSSVVYVKHKLKEAQDHDTWDNLNDSDKRYILHVYWAQYQEILATKIVIDWLDHLERAELKLTLWTPFFCPPKHSPYATRIARISITTLLSVLSDKPASRGLSSTHRKVAPLPLSVEQTILQVLAQIVREFSLSDFSAAIFSSSSEAALVDWQACFDVISALPSKLANRPGSDVPLLLQWRPFNISFSRQFEQLVSNASKQVTSNLPIQALTYGLAKIVRSGFMAFDSSPATFWSAVAPRLRVKLLSRSADNTLSRTWQSVIATLPSTSLDTFLTSLVAYEDSQLGSNPTSKQIKQGAMLFQRLLGSLNKKNEPIWRACFPKAFLSRVWSPSMPRVLIAWIRNDVGSSNKDLEKLLQLALESWSEKDFIEKSPLPYHSYLTSMILLIIRSLPRYGQALIDISRSPMFLSAITAHLSTLRESVRLEGMLVAEEISKASLDLKGPVKPLEFGDIWEGRGPAYDSIRKLKEWLSTSVDDWAVKDWEVEDHTEGEVEEPLDTQPSFTSSRVKANSQVPGESSASGAAPPKKGLIQVIDSSVYDDYDDIEEPDLESYSIPPLPPAEDLEDIEDISAYTPSRKKPKPPIYIHDLCACLKSEDADKLDIGLREAESLIKRKANWGTELSDAAVELAFILSGLQDNFNLPHFEDRRRAALVALVSCSPVKVAPAVIEQFFTNHYSIHQRTTMLAALALGARTLAGLPTTISPPLKQQEIDSEAFPSQKLPGKLHQRYLKPPSVDESARELSALTEDITNIALSRTRENAEGDMPQAAKEKLLSVRESRHLHSRPSASRGLPPKEEFPAYNDLAVGTFIMPILNRFWLYLQDVSTSPQNFRTGVFKGGSAGSVTLLEPMLLSKFLATITILVDTARHSPHFLAVLAPETLELLLAIRGIDSDNEAVRTSLLQLALAVVDNSTSLDGGRMLARDYTKTIWQLKDWAEEVWRQSEGKGIGEEGRAAAGLLLRIDSVVTKTVGYV